MRWTIWRVRVGEALWGQWNAHDMPDESPFGIIESFEVVPASFTDSDVERVAEALRAVDWYDPAAWQLAARAALTAYLEPTTKGDT